MDPCNPAYRPGRGGRCVGLAGVGLTGALSLTAVTFTPTLLPAAVAGATTPASPYSPDSRDHRHRRQHVPIQRVHDGQRGTVELRRRGIGRLRRFLHRHELDRRQ